MHAPLCDLGLGGHGIVGAADQGSADALFGRHALAALRALPVADLQPQLSVQLSAQSKQRERAAELLLGDCAGSVFVPLAEDVEYLAETAGKRPLDLIDQWHIALLQARLHAPDFRSLLLASELASQLDRILRVGHKFNMLVLAGGAQLFGQFLQRDQPGAISVKCVVELVGALSING
eukprot:scaffold77108_cov64-Phaeocystis_antarctica.AAC.6